MEISFRARQAEWDVRAMPEPFYACEPQRADRHVLNFRRHEESLAKFGNDTLGMFRVGNR
jgi:hypothetical protein